MLWYKINHFHLNVFYTLQSKLLCPEVLETKAKTPSHYENDTKRRVAPVLWPLGHNSRALGSFRSAGLPTVHEYPLAVTRAPLCLVPPHDTAHRLSTDLSVPSAKPCG